MDGLGRAAKATHVTAVDFSAEILGKAQAKIACENVHFQQADITQEWSFGSSPVELISCSLMLEHVRNLNFVFAQASRALKKNGLFYIGELHPFKQYQGSKARFDTASGVVELECFTHHVSEYTAAASQNGFECLQLHEGFDDGDRATIPRILALLFRKAK